MIARLPEDLSEALEASSTDELEVIDPRTNRIYVICDAELHRRVRQILDRDAIREALRQMEAGETKSLDEAFDEMSLRLGFKSNS